MDKTNARTLDPPAHDVLRDERQALDAILAPKNVAVTARLEMEGPGVGRHPIVWNLYQQSLCGTVSGQPQAAQRAGNQGLSEHTARVPEPVDLAVWHTPSAAALCRRASSAECVSAGHQRGHRDLGRL